MNTPVPKLGVLQIDPKHNNGDFMENKFYDIV
jgi:hypothetical protein